MYRLESDTLNMWVRVPPTLPSIHHSMARISAFQADNAGSIPAGCSITIGAFVYPDIEYTTLPSTPIGGRFFRHSDYQHREQP